MFIRRDTDLSFNFALRKNVPLMDLGDEADPTDAPSAASALRF